MLTASHILRRLREAKGTSARGFLPYEELALPEKQRFLQAIKNLPYDKLSRQDQQCYDELKQRMIAADDREMPWGRPLIQLSPRDLAQTISFELRDEIKDRQEAEVRATRSASGPPDSTGLTPFDREAGHGGFPRHVLEDLQQFIKAENYSVGEDIDLQPTTLRWLAQYKRQTHPSYPNKQLTGYRGLHTSQDLSLAALARRLGLPKPLPQSLRVGAVVTLVSRKYDSWSVSRSIARRFAENEEEGDVGLVIKGTISGAAVIFDYRWLPQAFYDEFPDQEFHTRELIVKPGKYSGSILSIWWNKEVYQKPFVAWDNED